MHNTKESETILKCSTGETQEENCMKAQGDYPDQVYSDQMVLMADREDRMHVSIGQRQNQGGLLGSSPLRSDGSHVVRQGNWTIQAVAKDAQGKVGRQL